MWRILSQLSYQGGLSEISQLQKKPCMIALTCGILNKLSSGPEGRTVAARGREVGGGEAGRSPPVFSSLEFLSCWSFCEQSQGPPAKRQAKQKRPRLTLTSRCGRPPLQHGLRGWRAQRECRSPHVSPSGWAPLGGKRSCLRLERDPVTWAEPRALVPRSVGALYEKLSDPRRGTAS